MMFIQIINFNSLKAQTNPVLLIDNDSVAFSSGVSLPYWVKAGQKITLLNNIKTVSILEFAIDTSNNLKFSQAISLTSSVSGSQTVPTGKVWKIEAFGMTMASARASSITSSSGGSQSTGTSSPIDTTSLTNSFVSSSNTTKPTIFTSPKTYSTPGSYSWNVPPGVSQICIEVWGGGGYDYYSFNNSTSYSTGYGGGGGGYGYQCFKVIPMNTYSITVGTTGGGTSSVVEISSGDTIISATGGGNATNTDGGVGGISTATYNLSGQNGTGSIRWTGTYGSAGTGTIGFGGAAGNGSSTYSSIGIGGSCFYNITPSRANAGVGQVIIYW